MRMPPAREESGLSLVEMMVTILILGIALTVMYKGLSSMQRTAVGAQSRLINLDEARVLMSRITKDMRTAARLTSQSSPFTYAAARQVTLYANVNATSPPNRLNIFVDGQNRLIEEVVAPTGTAPNYTYTSPPTVRAVGGHVASTGTIFTYYDSAGAALTAPLSSADLLKVKAVEVTLSIREPSSLSTPPVTLINRVRLPNVDYNPLAS